MALSIILRRSASRVIGGGNRFYGNLIVPSASVPSLRQFCSSPSLSCQDNESLVKEAKRPSFDESLVNDLMSQVQALQRDLESLRKSYGKENESLVEGETMHDQSESVHKGVDEESSLKHVVNESSKDEGEGQDLESDKSSDEGKDSEWDSDDDDSKQKSSSESDNSDHESLSERDDKPDDESVPTKNENEELIKGIEEEITLAKKFMELSAPDAIVPADFPFKIKSEENSIVLTREYEGEFVQVLVQNPTLFLHTREYHQMKSSSYSMDLTVLVICMTSNVLQVELKCGARPEGISVYSMKDPADWTDNKVHMSEFSENLKGEFLKYLEARGITEKTTKFLYGYMLDKVNRDKLMILENIHKNLV